MVLLLSVVACRKPRWGAKVASELHLAGFTIEIPAGWRSVAELSAEAPERKLAPGTVGMMPEEDRAGVLTASVLVTARKLPESDIPAWRDCAEVVENARKNYSPPISDVQEAGSACTWHVNVDRLIGTVGIRKVGDTEVTLQCLRDAAGDPSADRVCDQVLATLHMR